MDIYVVCALEGSKRVKAGIRGTVAILKSTQLAVGPSKFKY